MRKHNKKYFLVLLLFVFLMSFNCLFAQPGQKQQDSLYLIGTITGESTEKRIGGAKGIGDVNGDGFDDFLISMRTGNLVRDQGVVKLYFGSADFDLNEDVVFHYPGTDSLNDLAGGYGVGDVNDDGYDDFVLTGAFGDWVYPKGKVFLFYGGETIDTIPVNEFYQPNAIQDAFGQTVSVGDIDKDGFDDFTISSSYNWTDGKGYVYLFWGGDTVSWERSITFSSNILADEYGISVANIGDVNQDGFDDMAVGAPGGLGGGADTGKVYVYYGGIQMDNIADTILVSVNVSDFLGRIIKNAGDLNGDEIIDFCIAQGSYNLIYTFGLENPLRINSGYSIDTRGDINKDGYDDIIIGDDWKIRIYLGSEPFDTTYDLSIDDVDSIGFAPFVSFAGDINNDGYVEIFATAPNFPDPQNPLVKIFIFSYNNTNGVKNQTENFPSNFRLFQNYPNPFNPFTILQYSVSNKQFVIIKIYDVLGREVCTLINEEKPAGEYKIEFVPAMYNLSSGIYFYQLKAGSFIQTKKMIYLK